MKFVHPQDTKAFAIGVIASIAGVILWDIIKFNFKLLEYKEPNKEDLLFSGFDINNYKNNPFPNNEDSLKEIEFLESKPINEPAVRRLDKVAESFNNLLELNKKAIDKEEIKKLTPYIENIITDLKKHYNRSRPYELKNIDYVNLDSAKTKAYPSGHSLQGRFFALYFADKYPNLKDKFLRLGESIGQSRLNGRVHYPSDHSFGKLIADDLYKQYKINKNG